MSPYAGFWFELRGERVRVLQVVLTRPGHFLLQLDRHLTNPDLAGARFILPTANPRPLPTPVDAVALPPLNP